MLRSLNLNEKVISKQDEEKIQKRRVKFAETLIQMHQVFTEKCAKLVSLGLYQRAFDIEPPALYSMYSRPAQESETCDDIMSLLKGYFFIHVFNDPLIRQSVKSFMTWMGNHQYATRLPIDMLQTYNKVKDL